MRQILQHLKTGQMELAEVPCPQVGKGQVLIQTRASLISAGTERMLVEFSQANLIQKARQQPEKVKQVLDKIKTDGLVPTLDAVFRKLDEPLPLGYCSAGIALEVGRDVHDLQPGDRVISNGPHAEVVRVPRNLCATIPDGVTDEQAAFTVLASIALQGLRLAVPALGEKFMVFGVGIIGLLTVQLLKASGCEVMAVDVNNKRLELAGKFGAETVDVASGSDPVTAANAWTGGQGVDGVLITASAKKDQIVHQAAESCRKRGRIVLVGVVDLNLRRSDFYEKEITFQVSCSYGPGRYDEKYEQGGQDYPLGYVRWTEQRNFQAVLAAMQAGRLNVNDLVTDRFALDDAVSAYKKIQNDADSLGVILRYPTDIYMSPVVAVTSQAAYAAGEAVVGVIGAGNFSRGILLPALAKTSARIAYIADLDAAVAHHAANKFAAGQATTNYKKILEDPKVKAVFIVVGHHLHASCICEALAAGKHVFVEKPLAMNKDELDLVTGAVGEASGQMIMVGFNRRFSPHILKIKELTEGRGEPLCMNMTINAGYIPPDHWTQDPERGGGRIIGEGCHFIDLLSYIANSPVKTVSAMVVNGSASVCTDKMSIALGFADGSIGTVNYFANGSKSYPKEMLEVFSDGRVLKVENFRVTRGYGFARFKKFKTLRQDKGHKNEVAAFIDRVTAGGKPLIPFDQLANVTEATFAAMESARKNQTITLRQRERSRNSEWPASNPSYNSSQPFATCAAGKSLVRSETD
ncbi:MAG: dehydrogenase [Planctomycetes bacterium B3_Pla]|nr:MAG: dehydrogenase [Planctomycetes bacterium B3_Pla]